MQVTLSPDKRPEKPSKAGGNSLRSLASDTRVSLSPAPTALWLVTRAQPTPKQSGAMWQQFLRLRAGEQLLQEKTGYGEHWKLCRWFPPPGAGAQPSLDVSEWKGDLAFPLRRAGMMHTWDCDLISTPVLIALCSEPTVCLGKLCSPNCNKV